MLAKRRHFPMATHRILVGKWVFPGAFLILQLEVLLLWICLISQPSPTINMHNNNHKRRASTLSKALLAAGLLGGAAVAPPSSSAATSSYSVIHNFSVSYRDNPICITLWPSPCVKALGTFAFADAYASWGPAPIFIHDPAPDFTSAFLPCLPGQSCVLSSMASISAATDRSNSTSTAQAVGTLTHVDPNFGRATGHSHVTGQATAINPAPRRRSYASANSAAAVTFFQGRVRSGRFYWQPIISSRASGRTSSVRWNDPMSYQVMDGSNIVEEGDLLSIVYEGSDLSGNNLADLIWPDPSGIFSLTLPGEGLFSIDLTNPYVTNPGLLKLQATDGIWTTIEKSGRFSGLTVPHIGDTSDWSIPVSDLYGTNPSGCLPEVGPDAVPGFCVEYDMASVPSSFDVNLQANGDGFAEAEEVPSPLPILGFGTAFAFSRNLRKRIKISKSPEAMSALG